MTPGAPLPELRLVDLAGAPAALPRSGTLLCLSGAFRPEAAPACAEEEPGAVVVVPDAPSVAAAWARREGVRQRILCDHRPRGAALRRLGFDPDRERVGWRVVVAGGVVRAVAARGGRGASPPQRPPRPAPAAAPAPAPRPEAPARPAARPAAAAAPGPDRRALAAAGVLAVLLAALGAWWAGSRSAADGPGVASAPGAAPVPTGGPAAPAAAHGPLPPVERPTADARRVTTRALELPNATLADTGGTYGYGTAVPGDGHPDGWLVRDKGGALRVAPDGEVARFRYEPHTDMAFASAPQAVTPGEEVEVRFTLHAGAQRAHPGSVVLVFFHGKEFVSQVDRTLEAESAAPEPVRLVATTPAGADRVQVRWGVSSKDAAGEFGVSDLRLEVNAVESTARFPLPHVILVTIETLRADHTSLAGYARDTTPALAALAAEGATFTRHYVQVPYTRPSLGSLVTSLYPARLGLRDNVAALPAAVTTVAERFSAGGYVTSAFLAQYLLNPDFGFTQGFDSYTNYRNDTPADEPVAGLAAWMEAHRHDNTFSWIHLFDPHGPYRPPVSVQDHFVGDAVWAADTAKVEAGRGNDRGRLVPEYVFDPGADALDRRHYVARYDADILYADQQLDRLFSGLRAAGLDDETLVVVTADHGESMTDHDKYFAHGTLWEHDVHVPMVVWAPGRVPAGTRYDGLSQHVDIVPTLLDYAGLPAEDTSGTSLRRLLDGSAPARDLAMVNVAERKVERVALVSPEGLKVVVTPEGSVVAAYDVREDPAETVDVASARAIEADEVAARYRQLRLDPRLQDAGFGTQRDASAAERAQLEALGYTEGEGAP